MHSGKTFRIKNYPDFRLRLYSWISNYSVFCVLDSQGCRTDPHGEFELIAGCGKSRQFQKKGKIFPALKKFLNENPSWLFGFLSYDLKNEIEDLNSENADMLHAPLSYFFVPDILIRIRKKTHCIISSADQPEKILNEILNTPLASLLNRPLRKKPVPAIQPRLRKKEYARTVNRLIEHIRRGDLYEINLCTEFFSKNYAMDPAGFFLHLSRLSPTPFSAFFRKDSLYVLCASPERFLKIRNRTILSQPVKGTSARGKTRREDDLKKRELKNSIKNRAENIMIVDLVRNDLYRSCMTNSVGVRDLFSIQSFSNVHQMVSTVYGRLRKDIHPADAIKNAFPMGSMTGAPKIKAMELIEKYEKSRRGIFSGSVGYFSPVLKKKSHYHNCDFNVVIRTVLYDEKRKSLSFQAGGAIVYDSEPAAEYKEILLKVKAILSVLRTLSSG